MAASSSGLATASSLSSSVVDAGRNAIEVQNGMA